MVVTYMKTKKTEMKNEYEILSSSCQRFYAIDFFLLKRYSVRTINIMEP